MNLDKELKIAEVVSENIKAADIFKKHGIDFCCGGGISIAKACEKKNLNIDDIMSELKNLDNKILPSQNFNKWELDFLTDYIVNTHHAYVLEAIELLDAYSVKVAKVHGENHPPVLEIERLYNMVKMELLQHMQKEEHILFPYIKQMVNSKKQKLSFDKFSFWNSSKPN